jgi:hypothetical protein
MRGKMKKFGKTPSEKLFNHTMVGHTSKTRVTPSLYNPHNYRLYFKFTKDNFKPSLTIPRVWFCKFKNYGKEFTALGYGVRITIKKNQAEVINKLSDQEWFYINRVRAKEEITAILNQIDKKCTMALGKFIDAFGGSSDYIILKREGRPDLNLFTESDNKVMQEPFIDTLPYKLTFETPIVKKPYKKRNVEFKKAIYAAQHLENSALNEFAPQIVEAIRSLESKLIPKEEGKHRPDYKTLLKSKIKGIEEGRDYDISLNRLLNTKEIYLQALKRRIFGDNIDRIKAKVFV